MGKVVGEGKFVARSVFKRDRRDVTLEWAPLVRLLTPHKLFSKALLDEHGIRFPEGRRRLEDHVFTMHAYFHAQRISVLAGYPCYHWVMREEGENASYAELEPAGYYGNVREVLDLIDEHMEPGPLRDRVKSHWYRGKMLGRVGGRNFMTRDPAHKRPLYEEIRRLALERFGDEVNDVPRLQRARPLAAAARRRLRGARAARHVRVRAAHRGGAGRARARRGGRGARPRGADRGGRRTAGVRARRRAPPVGTARRARGPARRGRARRHGGHGPQLRRRAHHVQPPRHRVPAAHGHRRRASSRSATATASPRCSPRGRACSRGSWSPRRT